MRIKIDLSSKKPIYMQISEYFREAILSGSLPSDTRLPSTRQLAKDLGVNRLTVENAYAGLLAEGRIASRQGSGTYVLPPLPETTMPRKPGSRIIPKEEDFSAKMESLLYNAHPAGLINFAFGGGDPRTFPVEDFRKTLQNVIRRDGLASMDYAELYGYAPLRQTIANVLASQGVSARGENILITTGSQQAISLAAEHLLNPGDTVLVESPTYGRALELFRMLRLRIAPVPLDGEGAIVSAIAEIAKRDSPKMFYTIPTFQNPTGTCLSGARRRQLVQLAKDLDFYILEDDYVGDLRYEGHAQPTLKSLDQSGRVVYVSTFSKMLMPGLRVGFLMAEEPLLSELARRKRVHDLASPSLAQRSIETFVTIGRYQSHLRRTSLRYRRLRDAMVDSVRAHIPNANFRPPKGGFFLWLRLPEGSSSAALLPQALEAGVAFAPGAMFFADPADGGSFLRLSFAAQTRESIEEGISALGKLLRQTARQPYGTG